MAERGTGGRHSDPVRVTALEVASKAPIEPCERCIGRLFVANGAAVPSGVADNQVLHADDLPPNARVIRATDGIADVRRDPDRLTILVGEDSRVVDAV